MKKLNTNNAKRNNTLARITPLAHAAIICVGAALLLIGCPDQTNGGSSSGGGSSYICENGTPITGLAPATRFVGCQTCNNGFSLNASTPGAGVACVVPYTCQNGTPIFTGAPTTGLTGCQTCNSGFTLNGMAGISTACVADTDNDGIPNSTDTDDDGDGTPDTTDVDDDNNGLIEISTLEQLHNMRYDLAGNSYKTSASDTGDTTGAPTTATADCTTAVDGLYLCGYELTQNLDFDLDRDGSTYVENPPRTYTLDSGDTATPHFVTSAGGWEPIGDGTVNFTAVFDGNGFTIANIAVSRNLSFIGLFGSTNNAVIRNVGLVDALMHNNNTSGSGVINLGGLVSFFSASSSITASYTTGVVDAGTSSGGSSVGGLAAWQLARSVITASHSASAVYGNNGNGAYVGGLVGQAGGGGSNASSSIITASYATGNVDGGAGDNGYQGGLVGWINRATVTASYATGNVSGGAGNSDRVGGLAGEASGTLTASYATGNVSGGAGNTDRVGGLAGEARGALTANYATGNASGGLSTDTDDYSGNLVGLSDNIGFIIASYGFGTAVNGPAGGISTKPTGVTAATALTLANTESSGCDSFAYITQTACTAATKAAGVWSNSTCSAPPSGATNGVDYTVFFTQANCTATNKTPNDWLTISWNNASDTTLDAWVFTPGKTPKLRYADYDGSGTKFACSQFLSSVNCGANGDFLPGQPGQ